MFTRIFFKTVCVITTLILVALPLTITYTTVQNNNQFNEAMFNVERPLDYSAIYATNPSLDGEGFTDQLTLTPKGENIAIHLELKHQLNESAIEFFKSGFSADNAEMLSKRGALLGAATFIKNSSVHGIAVNDSVAVENYNSELNRLFNDEGVEALVGDKENMVFFTIMSLASVLTQAIGFCAFPIIMLTSILSLTMSRKNTSSNGWEFLCVGIINLLGISYSLTMVPFVSSGIPAVLTLLGSSTLLFCVKIWRTHRRSCVACN